MPHKSAEARRAYYREWKKGTKKRLSNKYSDAARHANERAAKYGCEGVITTADARAVLEGASCFYCGSTTRLGLDHRVPLVLGGPNRRENLVAACASCNSSKYRNPAPRRWARDHDQCVECGSPERRHVCRGLCSPCYWRDYYRIHPRKRT